MNRTGIEYLTHTWNPIAMRCSPASEGCRNCWHLAMARRHAANPTLRKEVREARAGGKPWLDEEELEKPLHQKKPAVIGVMFMGDLFHDDVPYHFLGDVAQVMHDAPQHRFLLLTKRPKRALEWTTGTAGHNKLNAENIAVGVSVETDLWARRRVPDLLEIECRLRFVSVEPCLSDVGLRLYLPNPPGSIFIDAAGREYMRRLDWVVAGAETGPGARPMQLSWARDLRDQCREAQVPFFFKSAGPGIETPEDLRIREWPKELSGFTAAK